jgi:hypothetical protein
MTLLINENSPTKNELIANILTGGIAALPDFGKGDALVPVTLRTVARVNGAWADTWQAGDVLTIGIGDGIDAPVCVATITTALPSASVTATNVSYSAGPPATLATSTISFTAGTYGGLYSVTATANSVTTPCGNISPIATPSQFLALLQTNPQITASNCTVTQIGATFVVQWTGNLAGTSPTIAVTNVSLLAPVGASGALGINTSGIAALFAGTTANQLSLVFEVSRTRGSVVQNLYQETVTILRSVIDPNNIVPTPPLQIIPDFLVMQGTGLHVNIAAGITGGNRIAAQSAIALADNSTNYVEVTSVGVAAVNQSAWVPANLQLAKVVTASGAITSITEARGWVTGGGVGLSNIVTTNELWVDAAGNDSNPGSLALPFLTIGAAKSAASSGTLIHVGPGSFSPSASISKAGVNYNFETAGISLTSATAGIIDDGGTAMTEIVSGNAALSYTYTSGNYQGAIQSGNSSSAITVKCRSVNSTTGAGNSSGVFAVYGHAGTLTVSVSELITASDSVVNSGVAVYWDGGTLFVDCPHISATDCALWSQAGSSVNANVFVTADIIETTNATNQNGYATVMESGTSANAVAWYNSAIVKSPGPNASSYLHFGAGKVYGSHQKIFGCISATTSTGLLYLGSQKIEAVGNGTTGSPGILNLQSGTNRIRCDHWNTNGFTGHMFVITGGTNYINGGDYIGNSSSNGFEISGGTITIENMVIDTSANSGTNAISVTGGTVFLINCEIKSNSSGKDISNSGGTVYVIGGSGSGTNGLFVTSGTVNYTKAPTAALSDTVTTNANLTGDVTSVGNATTLATSGVTAGTYGSATVSAIPTVDAKGRVTVVTTATITPAIGSVTGLGTGVAAALGNAVNGSSGVFQLDSDGNATLTGTFFKAKQSGTSAYAALTGGGIFLQDSTGTYLVLLKINAAQSTSPITLSMPLLGGTLVGTGDVGSVTASMLYGGIPAAKLAGIDIATVGTITTGTWNGSTVTGTYGGTGVNNGSNTLTYGGNTTISGGGTISLGGFTLTVPATGTAALLATSNTFTAAQKNSTSGAASTPAKTFTGAPYAGTGTTSFPLVYLNNASATASTTMNTAGTVFGINSHGTSDLVELMVDGAILGSFDYAGNLKVGALPTTSYWQINGANNLAQIALNSGGAVRMSMGQQVLSTSGLQLQFNYGIYWSNTYLSSGTVDTAITRNAAGVVQFGNSSTNNASGSWMATNGTLSGTLAANGAFVATPQALSGAGAVNLTTTITELTATAPAHAVTLANGTSGQVKIVKMVATSGGGTCVITPTTAAGYTTITISAVGQQAILVYSTTGGWSATGNSGVVIA